MRKFLRTMAPVVAAFALVFAFIACNNDGPSDDWTNKTPTADDYTIVGLAQRANAAKNNVVAVDIKAKSGFSSGKVTVKYNGAEAIPQEEGSYTVTFDVAAADDSANKIHWLEANGLAGGTLVVKAPVADVTVASGAYTGDAFTEILADLGSGLSGSKYYKLDKTKLGFADGVVYDDYTKIVIKSTSSNVSDSLYVVVINSKAGAEDEPVVFLIDEAGTVYINTKDIPFWGDDVEILIASYDNDDLTKYTDIILTNDIPEGAKAIEVIEIDSGSGGNKEDYTILLDEDTYFSGWGPSEAMHAVIPADKRNYSYLIIEWDKASMGYDNELFFVMKDANSESTMIQENFNKGVTKYYADTSKISFWAASTSLNVGIVSWGEEFSNNLVKAYLTDTLPNGARKVLVDDVVELWKDNLTWQGGPEGNNGWAFQTGNEGISADDMKAAFATAESIIINYTINNKSDADHAIVNVIDSCHSDWGTINTHKPTASAPGKGIAVFDPKAIYPDLFYSVYDEDKDETYVFQQLVIITYTQDDGTTLTVDITFDSIEVVY
ncbi:MAG: hypothetical protein LBG95_02980 [Treponema sp.]|nr:hypothetical protein [Treponema sp.]